MKKQALGLFVVGFSLLYAIHQSSDFRSQSQAAAITVSVDLNTQVGTSEMEVGVTHTQYSLDSWQNATALASGKEVLKASAIYQNQHIMGWGARNPEPSPGTYDWTDLDRRIKLIRETGGIPVITLCCAPDWMKGGTSGQTDWNRLTVAPLPQYYDDFANLAKEVAKRYPDVKYYQVWNELKGFWSVSLNRYNHEGYTQMYNLVYQAVKSVTPDARIGGPYSALRPNCGSSNRGEVVGPYGAIDSRDVAAIKYWLINKVGADMIVVDGNIQCDDTGAIQPDPFTAAQFYADVDTWLRKQTDLPIWWGEWYATSGGCITSDYCNAVYGNAMLQMLISGTNVALRWQPEENGSNLRAYTLWSDPGTATGGKPMPFYTVQKTYKDHFGKGTKLYKITVSSPTVIAAVSSDKKTLLINKTGSTQSILLNGKSLSLKAYQFFITDLPVEGVTRLNMQFALHGIGKGGDNVNPNAVGNMDPLRKQRTVSVEIYNASNQLVTTKQGTISFDNVSGKFAGSLDAASLANGVYTLKIKIPYYLRKSLPGIVQIAAGQTIPLPSLGFTAGDSNNDNALSILDYNILLDCFSDLIVPRNCADEQKKTTADLTDDGKVNQFDYNLLLRELSVQSGE